MVPFIGLTVNVKPNRICRYLVDEGGKAVVQFHNLVLLLVAYSMDSRVNIYLQRHQQALVDGHGGDWGYMGGPIADLGDAVRSHGPAAEAGCLFSRTPQIAAHTCGGGDLTAWQENRHNSDCFNL